jgi:hypothetical protein
MMNRVELSPQWLSGFVRLRSDEMRYGYEARIVSAIQVVKLVAAYWHLGPLDPVEEAIASLTEGESHEVSALVKQLAPPHSGSPQVWADAMAVAAFESGNPVEERFDVLEAVAADFDYPQPMQKLLRFMPNEQTLPELDAVWREFCAERRAIYAGRR